MKAKKLLATGLALGILTSTASLYTDHEAQAASKQHHQVKKVVFRIQQQLTAQHLLSNHILNYQMKTLATLSN
ncbi:TPA: hypothetical protein LMV21_002580 [Staphylococcus pseudintermedius]|nr:hypothetical protein [Staphylococcus pseudintermedius]HBK5998514.1 hypothetical protein [Staphylococcus pseudintermedius]HBK6009079.1 hypothetical protein [Staphylococcus pseudintermedius]HBK6011716.1 hypothetical protein [Staphylococcus pseudintermedius]HBK6037604.1 hypothetical protein [Staphylococcus pseudintermedius]